MSYRTMGRKFDWDLEKYRLSAKSSDKGNRRRLMKNLTRFVKNPFGYSYWKLKGKLKNRNFIVLVAMIYGTYAIYSLWDDSQ